ncbi:MAG: hypothetical protein AAF203_02085 [Pseudomonadota bacterium]
MEGAKRFISLTAFSTHVFCASLKQGSQQFLYCFDNIDEMNHQFNTSSFEDDFDHGFFYQDSSNSVRVRWKNRAGEIQLCGSGAFALNCYLQSKIKNQCWWMSNDFFKIKGDWQSGKATISLPSSAPSTVKPDLWYHHQTGIYFQKVSNLESLKSHLILKDFLKQNHQQPHGYCAFYWNSEKKRGTLRYFCPWHGRNEDSVTGSIQRHLNPLIQNLTGQKEQKWTQLSHNGGQLTTRSTEEGTQLSGDWTPFNPEIFPFS